MKSKYLSHYEPLVQDFSQQLKDQNLLGLEHMPQPFLPLFGKEYESSRLKLMIMGQDTRGWGKCSTYIEGELDNPSSEIATIFSEIEDRNFTQSGNSTNSFWGFAMALLSSVHGVDNWTTMKWGAHSEILSSFAWANSNVIELWASLRKYTKGVPHETWKAVRAAGTELTRLQHALETTNPDVIILTCWSNLPGNFFDGLTKKEIECEVNYLKHYYIEDYETHILHTYHPGYMRNLGGPWGFLNDIRNYLKEINLAPDFPEFVNDDEQSKIIHQSLTRGFRMRHPQITDQPDKYKALEWIAEELNKYQAFMSIPVVAQLLNELGYRTDYGTEYAGGRGSYRLVRGAYHRCVAQGDSVGADRIARVFRKPDFTYAY